MPKNAFTKGPVEAVHMSGVHGQSAIMAVGDEFKDDERWPYHPKIASVQCMRGGPPREIAEANAQLIATAFNTATKLAEMGCDAQKAIEALPKLIERLMAVQERLALNHAANRRCLPSHSVERMVREITDTLDDAGLLTKAKGEEA